MQNITNKDLTDTLYNMLSNVSKNYHEIVLNFDADIMYIKDKFHSDYYFSQNPNLDPT